MSVKIDPSEVLSHLNQMGYCGITAEQLREFISDLKKLIKYDLRQCSCKKNDFPHDYSEFVAGVSRDGKTREFKRDGKTVERGYKRDGRRVETSDVGHAEHAVQTDEIVHTRGKSPARLTTAGFNGKASGKQRKNSAVTKSYQPCKPDNHENPQRSSFIKSWRLQGQSNPRRSDPVALYHKYQTMWQRQKVPGDNAHIGLRWTIREKMLGEDPNPRPVSRASSVEPPGRRHRTCSRCCTT